MRVLEHKTAIRVDIQKISSCGPPFVSTTIGALDYSYTVSGYFVSQYYFQSGIGHSRGESPTIVVGDMESYALLFTVCYVCRCTTHCMHAHRLRAVVNCGQDQRYRNPLDWEFCCFCRAGGCLYPCLFDPAYATAGLARSNMCGCACVFTNSDWCPPHKRLAVVILVVAHLSVAKINILLRNAMRI